MRAELRIVQHRGVQTRPNRNDPSVHDRHPSLLSKIDRFQPVIGGRLKTNNKLLKYTQKTDERSSHGPRIRQAFIRTETNRPRERIQQILHFQRSVVRSNELQYRIDEYAVVPCDTSRRFRASR